MHDQASPRPFATTEVLTRIASALVLGCATVALAWSGVLPFAGLVGVVSILLVWEYGRLVRSGGIDALTMLAAASVSVAAGLTAVGRPGWGLLAAAAGALVSLAVERGRNGVLAALGVAYVGLPAVALVWLRTDEQNGLAALLFVLVVVWATDTGAFFGGRLLGGPRLCPSVSPNKTWSGLLTGVTAAAITGALLVRMLGGAGGTRVMVLAAGLAALSQLGDLVESAMKRAHGVKDTSHLIPGHGGFMDRVDGLVFAAVAAAAYAALTDAAAPGASLLGLR
ncbi:MAG: phosphatidate cytidylyltransferase [Hyphomicrobiaceae bacterium]